MYHHGKGVQQNYSEAVKWFQLAAEQGLAKAQYNLGAMYGNGKGVRQDKKLAKDWFWKSCDHRNQDGCDNYRVLNEQGY